MTLPRLLLIVLAALALYVAADGRTSQEALRAQQTATGPQTAPEWAWASLNGSGRLSEALATRPTSEEEADVPRAGSADLTPLARPLSKAEAGNGHRPSPPGRVTVGVPSPAVARPNSCESPCAVDVAEWDQPTPEPVLRPLASDCRLPCYGTARIGPASWYNAGSGYYAAIPGYLGGVVSVAVCTFPEGRANCHTFPVTSSCQCYRHERRERVVDLSPAAFRLFASLSSGLVMVQITVLR